MWMCGRSVKAGGRHWGIKADRINSLLGPFFFFGRAQARNWIAS